MQLGGRCPLICVLCWGWRLPSPGSSRLLAAASCREGPHPLKCTHELSQPCQLAVPSCDPILSGPQGHVAIPGHGETWFRWLGGQLLSVLRLGSPAVDWQKGRKVGTFLYTN